MGKSKTAASSRAQPFFRLSDLPRDAQVRWRKRRY